MRMCLPIIFRTVARTGGTSNPVGSMAKPNADVPTNNFQDSGPDRRNQQCEAYDHAVSVMGDHPEAVGVRYPFPFPGKGVEKAENRLGELRSKAPATRTIAPCARGSDGSRSSAKDNLVSRFSAPCRFSLRRPVVDLTAGLSDRRNQPWAGRLPFGMDRVREDDGLVGRRVPHQPFVFPHEGLLRRPVGLARKRLWPDVIEAQPVHQLYRRRGCIRRRTSGWWRTPFVARRAVPQSEASWGQLSLIRIRPPRRGPSRGKPRAPCRGP